MRVLEEPNAEQLDEITAEERKRLKQALKSEESTHRR
jgi:hypothetical protein